MAAQVPQTIQAINYHYFCFHTITDGKILLLKTHYTLVAGQKKKAKNKKQAGANLERSSLLVDRLTRV